jgi:DUF1680 family protein
VKLTIDEAPSRPIAIKLRIPGWLHDGAATVRVNGAAAGATGASGTGVSPVSSNHGQDARATPKPGAYFALERTWRAGDTIELALDFVPSVWEANPLVEETLDQVAVKYGPLVYCVESNDLPPGVKLTDVALALDGRSQRFTARREKIDSTTVLAFSVPALARQRPAWRPQELYREAERTAPREIALTLVPYYAWGNRGDTEMTVWLPVR